VKLSLNGLCETYSVFESDTPILRDEILQWCQENLKKSWIVKHDAEKHPGQTRKVGDHDFSLNVVVIIQVIEFEDDTDATLFKMRWM
jgi:hypothetical protein